MPTVPPFVNTRLNRGEDLNKVKQEELFEGITRNFEDLYQRFITSTEARESLSPYSGVIKVIAGTNHKANFGTSTVTFSASQESAETQIEHGLKTTPSLCLAIAVNAVIVMRRTTKSSTKVGFKGYAPGGVTTGTFEFEWLTLS